MIIKRIGIISVRFGFVDIDHIAIFLFLRIQSFDASSNNLSFQIICNRR